MVDYLKPIGFIGDRTPLQDDEILQIKDKDYNDDNLSILQLPLNQMLNNPS